MICHAFNVMSHDKCFVPYISTFQIMYAVPSMAVLCSFLIPCFPVILFGYFVNYSKMVSVSHVITGVTFVFMFHIRCICV
jgi:hypothetical protein